MSKSPNYDRKRRTSRALGQIRSTKADMIALQAVRRAEHNARCSSCSGHGWKAIYNGNNLVGHDKCSDCGGTGKLVK